MASCVPIDALSFQLGTDTFDLPVHPHLTVLADLDHRRRAGIAEAVATAVALEPEAWVRGGELADGVDAPPDRRITTVERLSRVDQRALWTAAEHVRRTAEAATTPMPAPALAPDDHAELREQLDACHGELEQALDADRRLFLRGALLAAVAGGFAVVVHLVLTAALGAVAVGLVVVAKRAQRRAARLLLRERELLDELGAPSYLTAHLERVDGLLDDAAARRRAATAADLHRDALRAWRRLLGELSPSWVLRHRALIEAAHQLGDDSAVGFGAPTTRSVVSRLRFHGAVALAGSGVLLVDEPLAGLDEPHRTAVLGTLLALSTYVQVVVLTDDPSVHTWACLEAGTGSLAVVAMNEVTEAQLPSGPAQ